MSTASLLSTIEQCQAFRLGQLTYEFHKAKTEARKHETRAIEAERLIENLGNVLDLDNATLTEIGQAGPEYFKEAREKLLESLKAWDDGQKIPVCLYCGSPKVDFVDATASWRCQDCGAVEERAGEGRKAA